VLEREPSTIRVVRADSLNALPSNSPVGSRMAIMLGGAAAGAARKIKATLIALAAHNLGCTIEEIDYADGNTCVRSDPSKKMSWEQLIDICHRKFHLLPPGMEPGLQATFVWEVPTGGILPTADGRVQMYPCYSFEAHVVLVQIDPDTGKPKILKYQCGHDCGVMINPDIVHGMTYGGVAHGIGASLYEKFAYTEEGELAAGTFMDYLIPSSMEVPEISIVDHCTPSPLTTFGQKGSGEAGYLGSGAALINGVNDALLQVGAAIEKTPMSGLAIWNSIQQAKEKSASV
jgi:2-furoyl-CoA dehydrogenase large subunit